MQLFWKEVKRTKKKRNTLTIHLQSVHVESERAREFHLATAFGILYLLANFSPYVERLSNDNGAVVSIRVESTCSFPFNCLSLLLKSWQNYFFRRCFLLLGQIRAHSKYKRYLKQKGIMIMACLSQFCGELEKNHVMEKRLYLFKDFNVKPLHSRRDKELGVGAVQRKKRNDGIQTIRKSLSCVQLGKE